MLNAYYGGIAFLNLTVLIAVLGGMTRREGAEQRVYYALVAAVLVIALLYAVRQSGLLFWFISDPNEGQ